MTPRVRIAPSILAADFSRLGEQVSQAIQAGAKIIHVDVMDGHFVPNLTIGPRVVEALEPITGAAGVMLDVHLMIEEPERLIPDFIRAGAGNLTVHVETCPNLHRTIQQIKENRILAGVTLNPATPLEAIEEILPFVDLVLVMSVNPGFGGQVYIPTITRKIARLRAILDREGLSQVELEVDGGIHPGNAGEIVAAGATILVAGSAIFNQQASILENFNLLQRSLIRD
ncbi:MAG: ribulose-phosphate 3-epimerase [Chloroflexi bacterium RBG_16_54_18]|nr:MAG: ribulose-phosphate 3-epimerase [Chloroflexi bacterium RBG_16_54_18]